MTDEALSKHLCETFGVPAAWKVVAFFKIREQEALAAREKEVRLEVATQHRPMVAIRTDDDIAREVWIYCSCGFNRSPENHVTVTKEWVHHILAASVRERTFAMTDKLPSDERVAVIAQLRYIAESPAQEHGGFHEQAIQTAKNALKLLEYESSAVALAKAGMREAAAQVFDKRELMWNGMKSGDAPHAARDARMDAKTIRDLPDSAADAALERFKADASTLARGLALAEAAKRVLKTHDAYCAEHGQADPETGVLEISDVSGSYIEGLETAEEIIRALTLLEKKGKQ